MTPKNRAIAAFGLRKPDDIVPTFELQFQLAEELLGRKHVSQEELDQAVGSEQERLLQENAELYVAEAERLDYSIVTVGMGPTSRKNFLATVRMVKDMVGEERLVGVLADATMSIPNGENMMAVAERIADDPDSLKRDLEAHVDRFLEGAKELIDAGAEVALMCADYCFNDGPFLSPRMFSQFVTPFLAKQIARLRDLGLYTVKHTDGDIMPILDQLVSCRPDALHSLDPQAGVSLLEMKRLVGDRVALCGNVHCGMLHNGTVEQVVADSERALRDGMPGGGFFFTSSNTPFIGMPLENYLAMLEVRHRFGRYDNQGG